MGAVMTTTGRNGFTLIELLFVVGIIGILSAVAAPALSRTKMAANESSAIATLRTINSSQQAFWATCGSGNYSPSLQNLGLPVAGAAGFVGPELSGPAPVVKSGYEVEMDTDNPAIGTSCNGGPMGTTYHATMDPQPGRGRRFFGANGGGAIFQSVATLFMDMPDTGAPPAPAMPVR
jgi:prepilin-type N-terminal cleavage/methylation domain-containing protein